MADINRDEVLVELVSPPRYAFGERVVSRTTIRNDGTFPGRDIGDVLVRKGDIGYVVSIGTFLQQYYIYAIEFIEHGYRVGMRAKELMTLDDLPEDVLALLGPEKRERLQRLGRAVPNAVATESPASGGLMPARVYADVGECMRSQAVQPEISS
jgi:nitrogen fixation protein NifZ